MVLAEQLGAPIPSMPVLLAMGALTGVGAYRFGTSIVVALAAALTADTTWYFIGRKRGHSVLRLLCRISLEPDSCVNTTRYWFLKLGGWSLVIAKFIPGLNALASPMAGLSRMPIWKFLATDIAGGLAWSSAYMGIGYIFRDQLEDVASFAQRLGSGMLLLLVTPVFLWIAWKYWQRRRFIRHLRMARVTPEELKRRMDSPTDEVYVVDLRTPDEVDWEGMKLPGASWFDRKTIELHEREIPRDRDIILYCSCPNEFTSAGTALLLKRLGITRVHPLEGGYDAWRDRGYPVEPATRLERVAAG